MRKLCLLLCVLACIVGLLTFQQGKTSVPAEEPTLPAAQAPDTVVVEIVRPSIRDMELASAEAPQQPAAPVMLSVYDDGQILRMSMEDYLVHVVAGEMPAAYEEEALKAQAVAARSYVAWKMAVYGGAGCNRGIGTDVCTDSAHCMAYCSQEKMQVKWGEDYKQYYDKISQAVQETAGEVMMYNGSPIQALFHSASGGKTEDAQAVWGTAFPYLKSVDSGGEEDSSQYTAQKRISIDELVAALNRSFAGAGLTKANIKTAFAVRTRTDSGRADVVKVGKVTATGRAVRTALQLNSANFTIAYDGSEVILTTIGFGHGVGMSQVGANVMAKDGSTYLEILEHYYTNVQMEKLSADGVQ